MPSPFKDLYTPAFIRQVAEQVQALRPQTDPGQFAAEVQDARWPSRELKDRIRHCAAVLERHLPAHFPEAAPLLLALSERLRSLRSSEYELVYLFLPEYIERCGLEHPEPALDLMERITSLASCEFAIRPFLMQHEALVLGRLAQWVLHPDAHVRRLASEGARPRLPWGMALPAFQRDPSRMLPLLAQLRADPSEYVRRSVANHLNDFSRSHPELILDLARQWKGERPETDALLKHACRTLLRQGHPEALARFGVQHGAPAALRAFRVETPEVRVPEYLIFSGEVLYSGDAPALLRLEYALYFRRAGGGFSRKVFKLGERQAAPGEVLPIARRHSFRPVTTRTYCAGEQRVALIINGTEQAPEAFTLLLA
ncbi:MAG: DNA alkylation repair protein [Bacteroidia bacterium]|nr:DNA alkylation repair protein [Bacteroidia bacterium]